MTDGPPSSHLPGAPFLHSSLPTEPRGAPVGSDTSPYASLPRHTEGSWVHAMPAVGAIWESHVLYVQSISGARGEERVTDLAYLFLTLNLNH